VEKRELGLTGIEVSALALGTVELGMDYGIALPGEKRIRTEEGRRLLDYAADSGINLFDTAPAYGKSERLLGKTLGHRHDCYFATKVSLPRDDGMALSGRWLQAAINGSLDTSLKSLDRDWLDIVQIHNATADMVSNGELPEILIRAKESGKIRFLGASVYGEEAARAVIKSGSFDVLQLAYNLLDQQMADSILPTAHQAGIGVVCRSALLKGALTERANWLPEELAPLREQAFKAMKTLAGSWERLPQIALRFCLSSPYIDTVLVGVCNRQELDSALEAAMAGPLDHDELELAAGRALQDERLINPTYWPLS
jgi:aryl-alcohol dehydrogenase-like predicted oxidoreductase